MYNTVAIVLYIYGGVGVASPALGAAGPVVKKIAFGIAIPTVCDLLVWKRFLLTFEQIVIAGVIYGHVASKYIFLRIWGPKAMAQKTWASFFKWAGITGVLWVVAFLIAERFFFTSFHTSSEPRLTNRSIPNFNDLLGVVSSLFASWFTYGISGIFWLFINKGKWFSTSSKAFLTFVNFFLILIAATVCGIGLYASGMAIHENDGKGGAWSCNSATSHPES